MWTVKKFASLRSLVVVLMLFNACRGEEDSLMLMYEWEEAVKGTWLPDDELEKITDPTEQYLRGCFKLAYLKGKGRKYVPVVITNDLLLSLKVIERDSSIIIWDPGGKSLSCSGWHAAAEFCASAGIAPIDNSRVC